MLNVYRYMFKIPDLRGKILFTLGIFALYRLGPPFPCRASNWTGWTRWPGSNPGAPSVC